MLRYQPHYRDTKEAIENIRLLAPIGRTRFARAALQCAGRRRRSKIYREGNQRYVAIKYSVRGRDLGSTVEEAIAEGEQQVKLPAGYHIDWAGEYESQKRCAEAAHDRLAAHASGDLHDPVHHVQFVQMGLAYSGERRHGADRRPAGAFDHAYAFQRLLRRRFLALFGVSVQTGVIMLEYINQLRARGHAIEDAAVEGAVLRLRPIMMTMLVATLGLLPAPRRAASARTRNGRSRS